MPQTINGIGTWYYGKKNPHTRDDTCEHCGNYAQLTSYDTTHFVVFVYIPLIPLGRYRVVDECGSCTKHYSVPFKEWDERKQAEVDEAARALSTDPYNGELARELTNTCAGYHDRESLARHESAIEQALSTDPAGMQFLASAYEYFKEPAKAEAAYRKSLALEDDPHARHLLGYLLISQGRPAHAKEYVWHLLTSPEVDDYTTLYFLVEAYQAQGMHQRANEVLDAMSQNIGGIVQDPIFQKYRKRVAKRLGGARPLASPLMKGKPLGHDRSRTALLTAAAVVAAAGIGGFLLFQKTQRVDVYLINGLDRPYAVRVADETYELAPLAMLEADLPRRDGLVADVSERQIGWPARIDIPIPANIWSALIEKRTYVVNPDQTAVLVWEETEYRVNPIEGENPTRVHLGRGFYAFDNIDYEFEEFPEEITLDSASSVERRQRLWRAFDVAPIDAYSAAVGDGANTDAVEYFVAVLKSDPDDTVALAMVANLVPVTRFEELARPHVDAKPLQMEWHRQYQTMLGKAGRTDELVEHYRSLLERDPDNSELKYLLGRITRDPDASERLLRASTEGDEPSAYGVHGLAYQLVVEGRFTDALPWARRAQELDPNNDLFAYAEGEALLALRRFDALIETTSAALAENPYDSDVVEYAIALHTAAGQRQRAQEVLDAFVELAAEQDADPDSWRSYLDSIVSLGSGDWKRFEEHRAASDDPRSQYQAALLGGDVAAAVDAIESASPSAYDRLVLYIALRSARETALADKQLQAAISTLSEGLFEERTLAQCLSGDAPPTTLLRLGLLPESKTIALAALSSKSGNGRLRQLGRRLNYQLTFERFYLDRVFY